MTMQYLSISSAWSTRATDENFGGINTGVELLIGQRFGACFVMKLPPQRGEGEKWEGVQISEKRTQNL